MVKFLQREYGDKFYVGGMGWGDYTKFVHPQEAVEIYNNAKVVITQSNFRRPGYFSDRNLNAIGCNVFTIQQYYEGIDEDYPKESVPYWKSFDDLKSQIDLSLRNPGLSAFIHTTMYDTVRNNHLWKNRFSDLLKFLEKYK